MVQFSWLALFSAFTAAVLADNFLTIELKTDSAMRYIVPAQMGTGSHIQTFNFALSMGTPLISVAGTTCSTGCNSAPLYNQAQSSTAQTLSQNGNFSLPGGGTASGQFITEDCTLPSNNGSGWAYPDQPIMVAANSSDVFNSDVSGIFGLQAGTGNAPQFNASVIGALFGRQPARSSFSYGMSLEPPSAGSNSAGQLHWLAADPSSYTGTVTRKNITIASSQVGNEVLSAQNTMTVFELDKWVVSLPGGKTVINAAVQAGLDPYYPGIYFPADQAKLIYDQVSGSSSSTGDKGQSTIWTIPCDTKFSLALTIGDASFSLDQSKLILKNSDGSCTSYLRGWADSGNTQYLFGSSFLSTIYLIFDISNPNSGQPDQVGFANRKSGSSTPVGAIVGGVIGGVALIALIIGGFWWLRIRSRQTQGETFGQGIFSPEPKVEPFVYNPEPEPVQPTHTRVYDLQNGLESQSPAVDHPLLPPPSYEQSHTGTSASGSNVGGPSGDRSSYAAPSSSYSPTTNLFPGRPQKN